MTCHEARRTTLNESLRTLAAWAAKRAELNVNTQTTLTMLRRKVEEIEDRVIRAGQSAAAETEVRADHAAQAAHNEGVPGMPQGPCQCIICAKK